MNNQYDKEWYLIEIEKQYKTIEQLNKTVEEFYGYTFWLGLSTLILLELYLNS